VIWKKHKKAVPEPHWYLEVVPDTVLDETIEQPDATIRIGKPGWVWALHNHNFERVGLGETFSRQQALQDGLAALQRLQQHLT
jgi:hypothetical protein